MKITYFGSAQFGIPCLEAIHNSDHELVGVFTQPARPAGRHRSHPKPTDVALWCKKHGVGCVESENINSPEMIEQVKACGAELLVVIAFGQKIGEPVINLHRYGAINVHASLLPKYRGAAPIHWAILNGEPKTGVSIITLAQRMDAGLVLAQDEIDIAANDNVHQVHNKLAQLSVPVLIQTIGQIKDGTVVYTPQDESLVTKAPKLKKEHGYINWNKSAREVVDQIRALWPWPGAQTMYVCSRTGRSFRCQISKAVVVPYENKLGDVAGMMDERMDVRCGKDSVRICELKPAGSKLMPFEAFVNGHATKSGDLFMSPELVNKATPK